MPINIYRFVEKENPSLEELQKFVREFVSARYMAVVGSIFNGEPRTFTCWYVIVGGMLYWKSRTTSEHSRAFKENKKASLCIYDHNAKYPDDKTGIQMIGNVEQVIDKEEMKNVLDTMVEKIGEEARNKNNIDDLCNENTVSTFYRFKPEGFKLVAKDLDVHMEKYEAIKL